MINANAIPLNNTGYKKPRAADSISLVKSRMTIGAHKNMTRHSNISRWFLMNNCMKSLNIVFFGILRLFPLDSRLRFNPECELL